MAGRVVVVSRAIPNAESCECPVWIIVKHWHHELVYLAGPWFSRVSAEKHLAEKRYNYGDRAFVWCASGWMSDDYENLCKTGRIGVSP